MNDGLGKDWASALGLIEVPLFQGLDSNSGYHSVLLDGGRGSFAISSSEDTKIDINTAASWIWSANLPHHVTVDENHITLSRWDDPAAVRRFSQRSVERSLEAFYEFLRLDQVRSKIDIVEHSMDLFRRVRSYVNEQSIPDEASIHVFLFVLSMVMAEQETVRSNDLERIISTYSLDASFNALYRDIESNVLEALITQFQSPIGSPNKLELVPQLLVRHASGTVFQEAHYEFLRGAPTNLFGVPGSADVRIKTRGGTHFTPPGLARSIVEQTFGEIEDTYSLTILDPACGAGAFLHEVLRYLQRSKYQGEVTLVGYDISPNAVAMARFTLAQAKRDWSNGNIREIRVEERDSLDGDFVWPKADVVLMNPPFISWGGMTFTQREQVKAMLGRTYQGRPDYSMAFIEKALNCVKQGGVVGTLMPASVLSLSASLSWRKHLLDQAVPRYLAVLGDHALFPHAMVAAAYGIFAKQDETPHDHFVSLWTSEKRGTTGEALRNLRRLDSKRLLHTGAVSSSPRSRDDWNISVVNTAFLKVTPNWRPRPNRIEDLLNKVREATPTVVADVFRVRQGIRTGLRRAFIIPNEEYSRLSREEQRYFRPAVENRGIRAGRIRTRDYIFYPNAVGVEPINDEADLQRLVPNYYERFLKPYRKDLEARKSLRGRDWWHLSWSRSWLEQREPKLVSAYFGDAGSFAWDDSGEYALVQGFAWLLHLPAKQHVNDSDKETDNELGTALDVASVNEPELDETIVYQAYLALLNSSLFELLLSEFCPRVAGGQYDLSQDTLITYRFRTYSH
jgi:adenine-specific DNA-methyltransferase